MLSADLAISENRAGRLFTKHSDSQIEISSIRRAVYTIERKTFLQL